MKKKLLTLILVGIMSISTIACGSSDSPESSGQKTNIEDSSTTTDNSSTKEAEATEEIPKVDETSDDQQTTDLQKETDNLVIELIAGEQGQYGELITMSEGTDMEESFYVYYVPVGTYEVTNEGDYMTQVSVYEGFTKNEETGYDEYTNMGDIVMLDTGNTDIIEVPAGWFIEIQEPAHISLTLSE